LSYGTAPEPFKGGGTGASPGLRRLLNSLPAYAGEVGPYRGEPWDGDPGPRKLDPGDDWSVDPGDP
jgi:hypothetical protein